MDEDLKLLLVRMHEQIKNLQDDVDQIKHVLIEGNGQPALTTQVAINRTKIEKLEEEDQSKKIPRAVWAGIIVSIVLSLSGFVCNTITAGGQQQAQTVTPLDMPGGR